MDFDKLYKHNPELYGNNPSTWIVKIFKYLDNPMRVLDLGICYGRNAIYLTKKGCEVVGVDISKVAIAQCLAKAKKYNKTVECHHQDISEFKFKGEFDVVYSTATLQYLDTKKKIDSVIRKMKKHTSKDGLNIISVPTNTKIAMPMPYYFKRQELLDYYHDWEVLEFKEQEDKFSNGKIGTIAFIIAKKI